MYRFMYSLYSNESKGKILAVNILWPTINAISAIDGQKNSTVNWVQADGEAKCEATKENIYERGQGSLSLFPMITKDHRTNINRRAYVPKPWWKGSSDEGHTTCIVHTHDPSHDFETMRNVHAIGLKIADLRTDAEKSSDEVDPEYYQTVFYKHEGFLSVLAWKQPACSYSRRHHGIKSRLRDEQPCFSLMNDYCWLVSHKSDVCSLIPISYRCWCSVWFTFVVSLAFPSDVRFIVTSQIPNCQQETRGLLYGLVKMEYTNTNFWKWFSNLLAKLYFSQHFGPEI